VQRLLSLLIAAAVVVALAASSGTSSTSTREFASNDGAASVSANWSGYALQDVNAAGLQFTSVTGTWKVPVTTCTGGSRSSAAFWVGLGCSSDTATSLEQTGTGADCNNDTARYYAWYEILPAAAVEVPLKVRPGDQITTSVNVNGTTVRPKVIASTATIRKAGDQVRITAQLVDATQDQHLWSERYDRPLTELFALQDEIRQKIMTALKVKLTPEEHERFRRAPTNNLEAYDFYLRGIEFLSRAEILDSAGRTLQTRHSRFRSIPMLLKGAS